MSEKRVMLTQEGYNKLVSELDYLKSVRRLEVAARLKEAIALGDLSENSEYTEAKDAQAFLEGKILEYEEKIANSMIINTEPGGDTINIGNTVEIREIAEIADETYGMVDKIYNVVDGNLEVRDEEVENPEEIYKIIDSDFKEVDDGRIYRLVNVNIEEIADTSSAEAGDLYRLIDGGLVKIENRNEQVTDQIYKISEAASNEVYGRVEKMYKVYHVVDEIEKFMIVGTTETNPDDAKISDECPLGVALVGNKVNGIAEVHAPVGTILYEIVKIEM